MNLDQNIKEEKKSSFKIEKIDYLDWKLLTKFISERGRILPKRNTNFNRTQQKQLSQAIKRARFLGLIPFIITGKAGR